MVNVAIFDYGAGNIFSLKNSLEKVGATVDVITNFDNENMYSGGGIPEETCVNVCAFIGNGKSSTIQILLVIPPDFHPT